MKVMSEQPDQMNQMFVDLAAAVDSASRSPAASQTIEQIGSVFSYFPYSKGITQSVREGNLVLPLEMLRQLKAAGDSADISDRADILGEAITKGLPGLRERVEQSAHEFALTVLPVENPVANWDAMLTPVQGQAGQSFQMPEKYLQRWADKHHEFRQQLESDLERLNRAGYEMTRAIGTLESYLEKNPSQLPQSHHVAAMQKFMQEAPEDPTISFVQAVSPASVLEAIRYHQQKGLPDGSTFLDPNQIVPPRMLQAARLHQQKGLPDGGALLSPNKRVADPSWPLRAGRNQILQDIKAVRQLRAIDPWSSSAGVAKAPFNIGLSLYGTGTYIWGVSNNVTELRRNWDDPGYLWRRGWLAGGYLAMYAFGAGLEGTQATSQILTRELKLSPSAPGWRGTLARIAENAPSSTSRKIFVNHLRLFGWLNVIGAGNYAYHGDYRRAAASGVAGAGTLLSTSSFATRVFWAGPLGTALAAGGSLALLYINMKDQEERRTRTEPYNRDLLIEAGLRPELAEKLAKNDANGISAGPKLLQLASHLGVTPQELLQYLNGQDPAWVEDFLSHTVHAVEANERGEYPASTPGPNLRMERSSVPSHYGPTAEMVPSNWRRPSLLYATTLEGIVEWAALTGHQLPRKMKQ
jgi:hypothetical protein